ncbi:polyprenyl synthetase family protein [Aeromicrobium sp. 179-A 4D2 NHS]|uniref:polyprenyl synthetase family protein n=1 Tax=Aeromicrobium sp. 179-A 4D2 NHS TaxID=3142375 RepID=UPI0039A26083
MASVGSFADSALEQRVNAGVQQVEDLLARSVHSPEPLVAEASSHLLQAGGKRFRPLLTVLCAEFGDPSAAEIVPAAVVVELTHLATLYHDDVMDEAAMRRGAPSANARWDNSVAILVGDFLFARASSLVADLGPEAVRIQADTFARLVHGQLRETLGPGPEDDPLQHYLSVVADKTGSLIATAARLGAMMSGAGEDVEATLLEFGERIGAAFQLADDIIDIASDSGDSGKVPGTDLREGVPTLPTLLVQAEPVEGDERLQQLLSGPIADEDDVQWAIRALREHPAMDRARAYVRAEADAARALLDKLPQGPARDALDDICTRATERLG